ncbi:MAG TPA: hypothetical protein VG122_13025 [Gemmata sp.]|jgi:hypothetical protein|nr:hypothetical protein [Gemmata sp.]
MGIGKEVVAHNEIQYPDTVKVTPSTFPLSVRNCHSQSDHGGNGRDGGRLVIGIEKGFSRRFDEEPWLE